MKSKMPRSPRPREMNPITPNTSHNDLSGFEEYAQHTYGTVDEAVGVKIFDADGSTTFSEMGISTLDFERLTWFFSIISLSWAKLFMVTTTVYVIVLLLLATVYHSVSIFCGAKNISFFVAMYFESVTLSANGGYMGEDPKMLTPGTECFTYRMYLVVSGSYINIIIGAMFAALFVSKAALTSKLQHRIVFSMHCTLVPLTHDRFNLSFRLANVSKKALVHGKLRLYMVSTVPWMKLGSVGMERKRDSFIGRPGGPSHPITKPDDVDEYVTVRTTELGWRCEEEFMQNEEENDLMLWFPCTITHRIDASSPLNNFVAAQIAENQNGGTKKVDQNFQVVAVFEAVDAETSAVIEKKHIYTVRDIVSMYEFAHPSVVVRDNIMKNKLVIDFYRFNELQAIE